MSPDLPESAVPLAEISQGPNAFEAFLDRNQKGLILFTILLALAAVAVVIYRGVESSRQHTAGAELSKAEDLAALQKLTTEHADTDAAGSAMVLLADRQWTAGKQDEAIATLRNFIAKSPDHPSAPTAKASLGAKLMAQGKSADASKVFSELASDPEARFIAPYALIALGDIAKAAGKLSEAEGAYTKAKTDFPGSSFGEIANGRLASVKAKAPVEIEPAPPSAPPAPAAPVTPEPVKVEAPKVESPPTQAPAPAQEPKPVSRENKSKKAPAAAKTKP